MATAVDDLSVNPLTEEDLERLVKDVKDAPQSGDWKSVKRDEDVIVWQKKDPEKPIHLIKSILNFRDIPPKSVTDIILDVESRTKWDRIFTHVEILESYDSHKIVYWHCKMPVGVTDRDIIQKMCTRYEKSTDTTSILFYNTTHPTKPPQKRVIRMETIWSGMIIQPHPDLPSSTTMSFIFQTDMKGLIPHFIVNSLNAKIPGSWQASLTSYYKKEYLKKKST